MLQLPTLIDGTTYYDFSVQLDGVTFVLTFQWNAREACWYFDLADIAGNPLLSGRRVVLNMPLLARFRQATLPNGDLMAVDTTGLNIDAGLTDLGDRVLLLYVTQSDVAAIAAGTFTP